MNPRLDDTLCHRLRPGVLARFETRDDQWSLYEPTRDIFCRLDTSGRAHPAEGDLEWLTADDLTDDQHGDDHRWPDGRFDSSRYYLTHVFRAHRTLREANLEINHACHYGCRHCFQTLLPTSRPAALPTFEALRAGADRLIAAGTRELAITGGDIFLHPDVWKLLDHIQRRAPRVTVRLLVNGGALDLDSPETARRFAALAGRRVIVKSEFYGHQATLHDDFTRVPGSFERLLRIVELCRETGVAFLAAGALTRQNFATRFELVNFLYNLTEDRFGISSILYPSDYRESDQMRMLRLTAEQHADLLDERYFAPLVAEYHSFESQCGGDCQLAVLSHDGSAWGCSFLKRDPPQAEDPAGDAALSVRMDAWRRQASAWATLPDCAGCSAESTCRRCPSFLVGSDVESGYCEASRRAHGRLAERIESALRTGFTWVHPRRAPSREVCHERR